MRIQITLGLVILGLGFLSLAASAQSNPKPQCPAGYEFVGGICQDPSSGDTVLPK
jgi:hypothetical protein